MKIKKYDLGFEIENQATPAHFKFDPSICESGLTQHIGIFGVFGSRRLASKKPVVKLFISEDNYLLKWVFHLGSSSGNNDTHSFTLGNNINKFFHFYRRIFLIVMKCVLFLFLK